MPRSKEREDIVINRVSNERLAEMIAGFKLYAEAKFGIHINEFSSKDIYAALIELQERRQICDKYSSNCHAMDGCSGSNRNFNC